MTTDFANAVIGEDVRLWLAQSVSELDSHRDVVTRRMHERLQQLETPDEDFGQAEVTAILLVGLLIDCGCDLAAYGGIRNLDATRRQHQQMDIDGRHYSRFGDALAPVLREVLGVRLARNSPAAWCDAYWYIIGRIHPSDEDMPGAS